MKLFKNLLFAGCALLAARVMAEGTAGIGLALGLEDGRIIVKAVLPESSAARRGQIHINDELIAVGQGRSAPVSVEGMPLANVVQMIRGDRGTQVQLTIVPAGKPKADARIIEFVRTDLKELANARAADSKAPAAYNRGHPAPEISGEDVDGKKFKLSDYRGKVVLVDFWGDW